MIMGSWDVTTRRYYKGHSVPSFPICQIKIIAGEIIKYRSLISTPKYWFKISSDMEVYILNKHPSSSFRQASLGNIDLISWFPSVEQDIHFVTMHACMLGCFSCVQLFATPWSPLGSPAHGILQARILEWVVVPSSRGSSQPRDQTCFSSVSCIGSRCFTTSATWKAIHHMKKEERIS